MQKKIQEKLLKSSLIITTLVMIVLRFLLNEKGRVSPDSIRFMRQAKLFPEIDNVVTPFGYAIFIKILGVFTDEFWGSKILGIAAFLFILFFAKKKQFYYQESVLICSLFSYVSIFSYTMSESLILPFVFVFLYVSKQIINEKFQGIQAVFYLSLMLILLYNIRYSALFFMIGVGFFGLINLKKNYGKYFVFSGIIGFLFVLFYQIFVINYFNNQYYHQFLEIGLKPTSQLIKELFQGLATSFNPFIHIANPNGGIINYGIYGLGFLNILVLIYFLIKKRTSEMEGFMILISIFGIICSFAIQYVYSVNALDYRLLSPFIFSIWLVYAKKLFENFGKITYAIGFLSIATGFIFTWLSKGNYLENRKEITHFLENEQLKESSIKFYIKDETDLESTQVAELISTVNPKVYITNKAKDTLERNTLTANKVLKKIKIKKNRFQ